MAEESIELLKTELKFRFSFQHSASRRRSNRGIFLRLQDQYGHLGYGEALSRLYVTGETEEDILTVLREEIAENGKQLLREPGFSLTQIRERLLPKRGGMGATCALELALFDLLSRGRKQAFYTFLGKGEHFPEQSISLTVPFLPRGTRRLGSCLISAMGFSQLKIKGSGVWASDKRTLDAFMRTRGREIRLDLNAALTFADAEDYLTHLAARFPKISWVEEPLRSEERSRMPELCTRWGERFVFCADESACRASDLQALVAAKAFQAVNIRVGKAGLQEANEMLQLAQQAGLKTQLGSLVGESSLLTSATAHLSIASGRTDYLEFGLSPLLLRRDPAQRWLKITRGGKLSFSEIPANGLVREFDWQNLKRLATAVEILYGGLEARPQKP